LLSGSEEDGPLIGKLAGWLRRRGRTPMATDSSIKSSVRNSSYVVGNLVAWSGRRREERRARPQEKGDKENDEHKCGPPQGPCADAQRSEEPEQRLSFRSSVLLDDPPIELFLGDPVEGDTPLAYSCARVLTAGARFGLELRFHQDWFFQSKVFGALSTSIALAPGERLTLTIRNTQRKLFDQTTLDQTEKATEIESTVSDKDVMNVARSSSRTNNWSLSGQGSFGLGDFSVGASGSVSETVTSAANSSAERVQESTSKSSEQLRTLHKVEVRESVEITTETGRTRLIENPYRDRSLRIDIYELQKLFCVEFGLVALNPCIAVDIRSLELDEIFVRTNGAFLTECLMDETLASELAQALALADQLDEVADHRMRAESLALVALSYLFDTHSVFGWTAADNVPLEQHRDPLGVFGGLPAGWDENDPSNSFVLPLRPWGGMQDATANRSMLVFTTLAVHHALYKDRVLNGGSSDGELALELALSLESAVGPLWMSSESGEGEDDPPGTALSDWKEATEVFRRLAGFLSFVSGVVRPTVQRSDEASEAAARRARFVVDRVIDHLNCHRRYYTERFMWYMAERSHSRTLTDFARWLLEERLEVADPTALELFDASAAYLDKSYVIMPLAEKVPPEVMSNIIDTKPRDDPLPEVGVITRTMVTVPTDGWHIEPAAGNCLLDDVPRPPRPTPVPVAVELVGEAQPPSPPS